MAKRPLFDVSTAYGQLILLVFLPICVLASVGAILVLHDTSKAARTQQQAQAELTLSQYELRLNNNPALFNQVLENPQLFNSILQKNPDSTANTNPSNDKASPPNNKHIQGVALIDNQGKLLASTGEIVIPANGSHDPIQNPFPFYSLISDFKKNQSVAVQDGTLYGKAFLADLGPDKIAYKLGQSDFVQPMWLIVSLDDEPLLLARYQVLLALGLTGLFTILLLLLSLNVYSRRWIAPIYEMRLHLQRTNASNLYKPMTVDSSGEINQLQQDLVRTLRRLHTSFQELKNHAEQTEDDLRLAFDEMEMQNISIRNARDAAVSSSQTKSAFLANISHELRTPLNSIDGFINLLSRDKGLSADQNLYVQTIRKSSAHLLALVNDVLDFSKIEAGKLVLEQHEFDLYASIYDVVDMLSPLTAEKNLRLAVFFYDDVPRFLLGDSLRVKQVLTNLVNNAIKFTDEGEVIVRVSLDEPNPVAEVSDVPNPDSHNPVLRNDERIFISVADTGRGIEPNHKKALFQSFSQGDPSVTRQYGGTGLGLVISKQLTQLMGGKIGFYDNHTFTQQAARNIDPLDNEIANEMSSPIASDKTEKMVTNGTIFWFTLPVNLSPAQQQQHDQTLLEEGSVWELPLLLPTLAKNSKEMYQLLVWIPHEASLQILKGSLNQLPIQITTVNSVTDLLTELQNHGKTWDWVIVDNDIKDQNNNVRDIASIFKQIRLYYVGKLIVYGYQINLDTALLTRHQVQALYQPLDRRQLYQILTTATQITTEPQLPKWQGFSVLAVDDHPPNLLVLQALLAELGISVVTANSGFEAIDYIAHCPADKAVDLIFMDIQMPHMSGREAAKQIRKIEAQNSHIPIIALTAHSLSDERESLRISGIDDYVGKPINQGQLQQVLQKWLGQKGNIQLPPNPSFDVKQNLSAKHEAEIASVPAMLDSQYTTMQLPKISQLLVQNPPELAVIDWDDALMRAAGKTDLAADLIMMLIDSIEQEKADLTAAWHAHDRQTLANIAHRILGASRYTGVPALRQASQDFEDKCLLNVHSQSPAQFILLNPFFEQLIQALDDLQTLDFSPWPALKYYRLQEHDMTWKMI